MLKQSHRRDLNSRGSRRAYSHHSPGLSSGSGGARLGLSQKGDLPKFWRASIFNWFKVADARKIYGEVICLV
jgi:hypothetical protein